jgi:tetratricopeptide (TPR) repeat protein
VGATHLFHSKTIDMDKKPFTPGRTRLESPASNQNKKRFAKRVLQVLIWVQLSTPPVVEAQRLSVAILPPESTTAQADAKHWQRSIPVCLAEELKPEQNLRVLPPAAIEFAFRQLKLTEGDRLTTNQVRKIGEVIEARRIVWGDYQRTNSIWRLSVRIMNAGTGICSEPIAASSTNWLEIFDQISSKVSDRLLEGTSPARSQSHRAHLTRSPEALDEMSRAYDKLKSGQPVGVAIAGFERAAKLDPEFSMAIQGLAYLLPVENRLDEALEVATKAVKLHPDYAASHANLGSVYSFRNESIKARAEFAEAIRLDPDTSNYYWRLGVLTLLEGKLQEAAHLFKEATTLAPYDASAHACLAYSYARLHQVENAHFELGAAQQYDTGDEPEVQMWLGRSYDLLSDPVSAMRSCDTFLQRARQRGMQTPEVEEAKTALARLQAMFAVHYVKAMAPQDFTSGALSEALRSRVTPEEVPLIINPFDRAVEMGDWAKGVIGTATNNFERAQRLFYGISCKVQGSQLPSARTALQAFQDWRTSDTGMNCQDYTFLYVTLARSIGLKANYALVSKDYRGKLVMHACAAVFIDGRALLVDPAYHWFGVPHQEYEILNDIQVIGYYLCQLADTRATQIGLKITPGWAEPRFYVAANLLRQGQTDEGAKVMRAALSLDSASWRSFFVRGLYDVTSKNWNAAVEEFQKCLKLNPDYQLTDYYMAVALLSKGNLFEARQEFRSYLQGEDEPALATESLAAIAYINEQLNDTR